MIEAFRKWFQEEREAMQYGPIAAFFTFFQGRTTTFAIAFGLMVLSLVIVGIWGFIHGKDLTSLASFTTALSMVIAAIFTGLVAHSTKEDWMQLKQQQIQQTAVNVTVDPAVSAAPVAPTSVVLGTPPPVVPNGPQS